MTHFYLTRAACCLSSKTVVSEFPKVFLQALNHSDITDHSHQATRANTSVAGLRLLQATIQPTFSPSNCTENKQELAEQLSNDDELKSGIEPV